ncbi:hypothetical protein Tco_0432245 [Tanacetum coccineum]
MDELIVHVSEKTYAYGAIRAENQDLLSTISELKTRLEKVEKVVQIVLWVVDNGLVSNILRILLLTGGRESNCILILQSHLAASSPFCIIPKATSTSHCYGTEDCHIFNFEYTINDHIPDYLLTVLPSFKDGKDHLVLLVNGEKQEKASLHLNCSSISPCHNQSSVTICNRVLKKHGLDECVSMSTPMATERLYADLQGTLTDQTYLRGLQFLGGKLVSWSSKKQDCTAMSTAEAEYVSLSACCAQVIWMRTQLLDYGYKYNRIPITVEKGNCGKCNLQTEYQLADLFTKALQKNVYENLVHLIIMAQQQHAADVHPDELCPPNKRYDLMDANKKVDLDHVQCPPESKILTNIIKNHPLRFSIAASSSVPWIYMAQFWHTLKEDGSKYRLRFMLDKRELTLTLDDFRQIFHLPQATANNHNSFVPPPSFSDMVPFYKQVLGFTIELKTQSNFKTAGLLQLWQTLCKIFSKCLTTRVTGCDQPPLQIMQMLYCFVNNIHVDYAELLWEGLYYPLHHPTSSIPYLRFTKIIVNYYMTIFPDISRRARDMYHKLQDDDIMKNIFNSGRHKNKVGMQIPAWMITDEMKLIEHYRMYVEVFRIDVPLTQSQPTESTQGTHRTPSAPRRSTRLTPPAPVPPMDKADETILQDPLQVSLAEHKSREEQEARENMALVDKHLASEEIEKMVDGQENISDKESPEVEISKEKEVEISKEKEVEQTNVVIPVNVNDEDEEITDEVYELKRLEKGKIVEETRNSPILTPIRSLRIHINLVSSDTEKLQELTDTPHTTSSSSSPHKKLAKTNQLLSMFKTKPTRFKRYKSFFHELQGHYGYKFAHLRARFMPRKSFDTLVDNLHDVMVETLPAMVDKHIKEQVMKQVPEQVQNQVPERGNIQAQISTQIENAIANAIPSQVDASVRSYMSGHILHIHPAQSQTSSVPEQQYQLYLAMKADPQRLSVVPVFCPGPLELPSLCLPLVWGNPIS